MGERNWAFGASSGKNFLLCLNNQKIGEKFVKLIDKAFNNYSLFQQNQNISEWFAWASEFKLKVKSSIDKWIALAGGEASKLLRSPQRPNRSPGGIF